jgi:hypothetical protein
MAGIAAAAVPTRAGALRAVRGQPAGKLAVGGNEALGAAGRYSRNDGEFDFNGDGGRCGKPDAVERPNAEACRSASNADCQGIEVEASQCRNRRVCETFNYETSRLVSVLFARAIRCFFSSLIEHNHFAQWYLARSAMKAEQQGANLRWNVGNKIASVNRQPVTQDGNVPRASSDTKRRRRRKFVARFPDLGDHNRIELWHALRRG